MGRCPLELAQRPSSVAPALHLAGRSTPFGVTTRTSTGLDAFRIMNACILFGFLQSILGGDLAKHCPSVSIVKSLRAVFGLDR